MQADASIQSARQIATTLFVVGVVSVVIAWSQRAYRDHQDVSRYMAYVAEAAEAIASGSSYRYPTLNAVPTNLGQYAEHLLAEDHVWNRDPEYFGRMAEESRRGARLLALSGTGSGLFEQTTNNACFALIHRLETCRDDSVVFGFRPYPSADAKALMDNLHQDSLSMHAIALGAGCNSSYGKTLPILLQFPARLRELLPDELGLAAAAQKRDGTVSRARLYADLGGIVHLPSGPVERVWPGEERDYYYHQPPLSNCDRAEDGAGLGEFEILKSYYSVGYTAVPRFFLDSFRRNEGERAPARTAGAEFMGLFVPTELASFIFPLAMLLLNVGLLDRVARVRRSEPPFREPWIPLGGPAPWSGLLRIAWLLSFVTVQLAPVGLMDGAGSGAYPPGLSGADAVSGIPLESIGAFVVTANVVAAVWIVAQLTRISPCSR